MLPAEAIALEQAAFRVARQSGDVAAAWRALERLHVLTQSQLWLHARTHIAMLLFALRLGDGREVAGQVFRLALAPVGNLTGRLPIGNTGRANVSAFAPMPLPDDLRSIIARSER